MTEDLYNRIVAETTWFYAGKYEYPSKVESGRYGMGYVKYFNLMTYVNLA